MAGFRAELYTYDNVIPWRDRSIAVRGVEESQRTGQNVLFVWYCPHKRWWLALHSNIFFVKLFPRSAVELRLQAEERNKLTLL